MSNEPREYLVGQVYLVLRDGSAYEYEWRPDPDCSPYLAEQIATWIKTGPAVAEIRHVAGVLSQHVAEFERQMTELLTRLQARTAAEQTLSEVRSSITQSLAALYSGEYAKPKNNSGWVYLFSGGGRYKIGKSRNPEKRARMLSVPPVFEVTIIHTIATEWMSASERQLHSHFAHRCVQGEWFDLTSEDVEAFKRLTSADLAQCG